MIFVAFFACKPPPQAPADYEQLLDYIFAHSGDDDDAELVAGISNLQLWLEEEDTTELIEAKELGTAIEQAISSMLEKRQTVFRLCFIQEFTYKEAAEFLDVSVKTIENHMGLALKDLRAKLDKYR